MGKKLLLLEDDATLNETIVSYLEEFDYEVIAVYDGISAENIIYEQNFDILLLDVNVPDINGFELLRQLRENQVTTPAIFITSLNSMQNLEDGFNSGCDDYIRKPFLLKELLLRIETILKREFFHQNNNKITIDDNKIYDTKSNLLTIDDKTIPLTNKESTLLKLFLQKKDQIIPLEEIYDTVWEYDEDISENALRTYIKNLRKYLGKEKIVSIKKLGYRFTTK